MSASSSSSSSTSSTHNTSSNPATTSSTATATPQSGSVVRIIRGEKILFPSDFDEDRSLYRPHGKWEWADGHDIMSTDPGSRLGYGLEGAADLKVGHIQGKEIIYISKLFSVWDRWRFLFSYLYLNSSSNYLRPLQGDCIPWIIGAFHCNGGCIGIAQELPHPTGWREADMFLEENQKEAIISAYQKLHNRGILHGDAEYRHWIIGDDGKVTIIDFGLSKVLRLEDGAEDANVEPCTQREIDDEMRKVKFMLNYRDSRNKEVSLAKLRREREEKDRVRRAPMKIVNHRLLFQPDPPREPMTEEEKNSPVPALNIDDVDAWSYGNVWIARRFDVVRLEGRAEIRKTPVPHPPSTPQNSTAAGSSLPPSTPAPPPSTSGASPSTPAPPPSTPAPSPSTPASSPSTPASSPSTPALSPSTPATSPSHSTPAASPSTPAVSPSTPAVSPSTPAVSPSTPVPLPNPATDANSDIPSSAAVIPADTSSTPIGSPFTVQPRHPINVDQRATEVEKSEAGPSSASRYKAEDADATPKAEDVDATPKASQAPEAASKDPNDDLWVSPNEKWGSPSSRKTRKMAASTTRKALETPEPAPKDPNDELWLPADVAWGSSSKKARKTLRAPGPAPKDPNDEFWVSASVGWLSSSESSDCDSLSDSGASDESVVGGKRKKRSSHERDAPEKKRRRHRTPEPEDKATLNRMCSKPRGLQARHAARPFLRGSPPKRTAAGSVLGSVTGWEGPKMFVDDPQQSSTDCGKQALRAWSRFSEGRKRYEELQGQLNNVRDEVERYRDEFVRMLLEVRAEDRKGLLDCIGQRDSLSILDVCPNRPPQQSSPKAPAVLQERRAQIARTVASSQVIRRPRKEHPRVTDIKRFARANYVPKVPSKLGPASGSLARKTQGPPASPPAQPSGTPEPSPRVKAALEKTGQFAHAVLRRAQLRELQEERATGGALSAVQKGKQRAFPDPEQDEGYSSSSVGSPQDLDKMGQEGASFSVTADEKNGERPLGAIIPARLAPPPGASFVSVPKSALLPESSVPQIIYLHEHRKKLVSRGRLHRWQRDGKGAGFDASTETAAPTSSTGKRKRDEESDEAGSAEPDAKRSKTAGNG